MAIKVKPVADVVAKWKDVTPGRATYYSAGVAVAGADWEKNTVAAAANYATAVRAGNIQNLFAGGVKRVGAEKYTRKATGVGPGRFSEGINAGAPDYEKGMGPVLNTIAGVSLSPRQPRGSDANWNRSKEVGAALHKMRLAARSAGV